MEQSLITAIASTIICFLVCFTGLKQLSAHNGKGIFWLLWIILFGSWMSLYFIWPHHSEFITNLYVWEIPSLAVISAGTYILLQKFPRYWLLILLLGAELGSFTLPTDGLIFGEESSFWLDRAALIAFWVIYGYCFSWLNTTDGIIGIQSLSLFIGICLLSLIGAAPNFMGIISLCGIGIFAAWQLFNGYPARLRLSKAQSWSIGFILGWLTLKTATEGAGSCLLCFNMFFIYQIIVCVIRFFTLKPSCAKPAFNSDFYRVGLSGLNPAEISTAVSKLMILLIIFGGFSAFSPNAYSVPLFSLMTCIWFFYRLQHWRESIPTLKEINTNIIKDIKTNVSGIAGGFKPKD